MPLALLNTPIISTLHAVSRSAVRAVGEKVAQSEQIGQFANALRRSHFVNSQLPSSSLSDNTGKNNLLRLLRREALP